MDSPTLDDGCNPPAARAMVVLACMEDDRALREVMVSLVHEMEDVTNRYGVEDWPDWVWWAMCSEEIAEAASITRDPGPERDRAYRTEIRAHLAAMQGRARYVMRTIQNGRGGPLQTTVCDAEPGDGALVTELVQAAVCLLNFAAAVHRRGGCV